MDMVHKFFQMDDKTKVTNLVFETSKVFQRNEDILQEQSYRK